MAVNQLEAPVELGYVGDRLSLDGETGGALAGSERYRVSQVAADALTEAESRYDGFLVDTVLLTGDRNDVVAAIQMDRPIVTVGRDETVTLPANVLPHVDAHLALSSGSVESLDALDAVFEERWRNLGMQASELLDEIFESVPVHLYVKDREARHIRVSAYYQNPDDLIGKTDHDIYEASFAEQTVEQDLEVMETGEPLLEEEELNPGDGDWSLTSKVPIYDDDEAVGLLGLTRNITKRKEYELQLERQKERLEEFASVISHDLRNPLTVAQGRVDLARDTYPENEHLEVAVRHLERMDELIEEVLTMTRQGRDVEETTPVDLQAIAKQCWDTVATGDATLTVTGEFQFQADHGRLRHVFENLFRNAVEHGSTSPRSTSSREDAVEHGSTSPPSKAQEDAAEHGATPNDSQAQGDGDAERHVSVTIGPLDDGRGFYVEDDGPGIPESDRDNVFDHGYTTSDKGTGLGLKIVRQVVEAHGWSITVTEGADGGARLEIHGIESEP